MQIPGLTISGGGVWAYFSMPACGVKGCSSTCTDRLLLQQLNAAPWPPWPQAGCVPQTAGGLQPAPALTDWSTADATNKQRRDQRHCHPNTRSELIQTVMGLLILLSALNPAANPAAGCIDAAGCIEALNQTPAHLHQGLQLAEVALLCSHDGVLQQVLPGDVHRVHAVLQRLPLCVVHFLGPQRHFPGAQPCDPCLHTRLGVMYLTMPQQHCTCDS